MITKTKMLRLYISVLMIFYLYSHVFLVLHSLFAVKRF